MKVWIQWYGVRGGDLCKVEYRNKVNLSVSGTKTGLRDWVDVMKGRIKNCTVHYHKFYSMCNVFWDLM